MIYNTCPGLGSMIVRNTNMVTMSSFVVMIDSPDDRLHLPRKPTRKNRIAIWSSLLYDDYCLMILVLCSLECWSPSYVY